MKRSIICPKCKSQDIVAITYGLPVYSDELKDELASGKKYLGGCIVDEDALDYHCNDCETDFSLENKD